MTPHITEQNLPNAMKPALLKRIIFNRVGGGVSVIYPRPLGIFLAGGDLDVLAKKDVPTGQKYQIVDSVDVPERGQDRGAWIVSENDLTDGVGE